MTSLSFFNLGFCIAKPHQAYKHRPPWREAGGNMNIFWKGVITGAAGVLVLVLLIFVFRFFHERDRKIFEYMEAQSELQIMQEDISNRPPVEFLEDPGVRGAADNAADEFRRKRDEAIQRIRSRHVD
jgi:flagellar biosynthesis/type III secretory pathway M-ring protein FliF/YscJ